VIHIEELDLRGRGIGRLEALVGPQDEFKRFRFRVRKAIPGDEVRVVVEKRRGERIDAHIDEIVSPSPMRKTPRCRHFGLREKPGEGCGGCTFQSLSYRHQLACKEKMVKRVVDHHGLDPGVVAPVVGCETPWFYRNNMEFTFGKSGEGEYALGMFPQGYHYELVNLEECYLQSEFVSEFIPAFRRWAQKRGIKPYINESDTGFARLLKIREGKRTGERLIEWVTTDDSEASLNGSLHPAGDVVDAALQFIRGFASDFEEDSASSVTSIYWTQKHVQKGEPTTWDEKHLWGNTHLTEQLHLPGDHRLEFAIHPRAFFQTNTFQAEVLYAHVLKAAGLHPEIDDRRDPSSILDLYCGTGTISLCLAPYAESVVGVERQRDAVEDARRNARHNDLGNVRFLEGDVGDVLGQEGEWAGKDFDLVVVDPPRGGLQENAMEQLVELEPDDLVYVSCNPDSLADNVVELRDRLGYRVRGIQPIDMFPQTDHIEAVTRLTRRSD
jgi:23S rRNA (uracil1939-C5)-methyltransferase